MVARITQRVTVMIVSAAGFAMVEVMTNMTENVFLDMVLAILAVKQKKEGMGWSFDENAAGWNDCLDHIADIIEEMRPEMIV